jgi:hypothetical protein
MTPESYKALWLFIKKMVESIKRRVFNAENRPENIDRFADKN